MVGGLTCNACNKEFRDDEEQKLHYKSEWHRYNLKRKVAGVPGVTEALFQARQLALAEEKSRLNATPMSYSCVLCGKEYRSSKAHAQHLRSKSHIVKITQGVSSTSSELTVIKPLTNRISSRPTLVGKPTISTEVAGGESEGSEDEWVEVDSNDDLDEASEPLKDLSISEHVADEDDNMDEDLDTSCCFICDLKHETIESCMVHMHKQHGFFIPDIEYLKDPKGFLTYLSLKVMRDFTCLYCNDRCQPFQSLEAVRKHMIAKGHCKVRYGNGGDDEEVELEEFYDYSSSFVGADGKQLVVSNDTSLDVELGNAGSELIITRKTENGISVKTFGSREFLRYYRQKPRPSPARDMALAVSLASRYRSMGLATAQSREQILRMKVLREMSRSGVETMRTRIGMKSNVIRNLPRNVPY
uniref:Zinc finger protein C550.15c n=1 Tax=Anthurium amnicola TaxID=1678845 RepID=A0A1D1YCW8_9ARAE